VRIAQRRHWRRLPTTAALLGLAVACSATPQSVGQAAPPGGGPLVVVSAPLTAQRWIGRFTERGARLAVEQLNAAPTRGSKLRLQVLDDAGSAQQAAANARTAVAEHAAAIITDGVGAVAVGQVTDPVGLPVFVVFQGGQSFIDVHTHPTLFRLAPANKYLTRRLADYVSTKTRTAAVLGDDTSYGRDGTGPLIADLRHNAISVVNSSVLPAGAQDVSAQVLTARRSGAHALLIWAGAQDVAAVLRSARASGWQVPIYTGTTGEDPLVRQQLADHPEWLDGTTFVSFRITTEQGPGPFTAFRSAFEHRYGPDTIGVSADGRPVVQPPDWATYSYDAVQLIDTALTRSAGRTGPALLAAIQSVSITSANGDDRGYGPDDREGVSPSDMYFARFHHMRFAPVTDDLLSTSLPSVAQ
jgi:ABC-type branched-subunit amino acid transport system substrate-binding protein